MQLGDKKLVMQRASVGKNPGGVRFYVDSIVYNNNNNISLYFMYHMSLTTAARSAPQLSSKDISISCDSEEYSNNFKRININNTSF